jgi:hypothetical protein
MKRILIVSRRSDAHVGDVTEVLHQMRADPWVLISEEIPLDVEFRLALDGSMDQWDCDVGLHGGRARFDLHDVGAIWWRKPLLYYGLPFEMPLQDREFARSEIDGLLGGLWELFRESIQWISHPTAMKAANHKVEQLSRAARFGFEIPSTIVTNDPEQVRSFYDKFDGEIVYKVFTDPQLAESIAAQMDPNSVENPGSMVLTTKITKEHLEKLDSLRLSPGMFQELLTKHSDVRVTIIDGEVFVVEMKPSDGQVPTLDWRDLGNGAADLVHSVETLPDSVVDGCRRLLDSYGIRFAAIDFVRTKDGRLVFVDLNPNGQFIWLEKLLPQLRMTEAMASCLVRCAS